MDRFLYAIFVLLRPADEKFCCCRKCKCRASKSKKRLAKVFKRFLSGLLVGARGCVIFLFLMGEGNDVTFEWMSFIWAVIKIRWSWKGECFFAVKISPNINRFGSKFVIVGRLLFEKESFLFQLCAENALDSPSKCAFWELKRKFLIQLLSKPNSFLAFCIF